MKKRTLLMLVMLLALAMIATACGGDDDDDGDDGGDLTAETIENALRDTFNNQDPSAANAIICDADHIEDEQAGVGADEVSVDNVSCEINDDVVSCSATLTLTAEGEEPFTFDAPLAYRIVDNELCGQLDPETLEPIETE